MSKQDLWADKLEVRKSEMHGYGIFATQDIPANKCLLIVKGEIIDSDEAVRRETEEGNVYIFWNESNYIDAANEPVVKYLNHDCNPNCYLDDRDENSLYLVSAREIKVGEEITIDYDYEEIYSTCNCNNCRLSE